MKRVIAVQIFILCLLQAGSPRTAENPPRPISLFQMISNPEKYESKVVFGVGFLDLSVGESLLFPHRHDYDPVILTHAIWIEPSKEMQRDADKLNHKYVKFVGTFQTGHPR